jgi:hypothetical protein
MLLEQMLLEAMSWRYQIILSMDWKKFVTKAIDPDCVCSKQHFFLLSFFYISGLIGFFHKKVEKLSFHFEILFFLKNELKKALIDEFVFTKLLQS